VGEVDQRISGREIAAVEIIPMKPFWKIFLFSYFYDQRKLENEEI